MSWKGKLSILLALMLVVTTAMIAGCQDIDEEAKENGEVEEGVNQISWGTASTGSSGHAALTALTTVLNREMDDYNFNVLPTPGAVYSMTDYAHGDLDGFYGANVGFLEYAEERSRFEEFDYEEAERDLVQAFWGYTLEVGLAVHADDYDEYDEWRDLEGQTMFTGPAAWDVRAALDIPLEDQLGMDFNYDEIDLDMVGSALDAGHIDGINAYTSGESTIPSWLIEAELESDIEVLNPSEEEIEMLNEGGVEVVDVDPDVFETEMEVDTVKRIPFYYGFHMGPEVPAEDVHEMLNVIKENTEDLTEQDETFAQINEDMVDIQVRGIESSVDYVEIHPGTRDFLEEHDAWDSDWDDRVAGE